MSLADMLDALDRYLSVCFLPSLVSFNVFYGHNDETLSTCTICSSSGVLCALGCFSSSVLCWTWNSRQLLIKWLFKDYLRGQWDGGTTIAGSQGECEESDVLLLKVLNARKTEHCIDELLCNVCKVVVNLVVLCCV